MVKVVTQKFPVVLLLLVLLAASVPVFAQTHLSGELGAELNSHQFERSDLTGFVRTNTDRRLANEYLNFDLRGPLGNGYLARYDSSVQLRSTQIRSEIGGRVVSEYHNPGISGYTAALSLFPNRSFPLKIYAGKSDKNSIRYEPGNQGKFKIIDQGLSVVRRYASTNEEAGALWRWAVQPDLEVELEVKQTANEIKRQYDFDEDRNIWIDPPIPIRPDYVASTYTIAIANKIPDRDVVIRVDGITTGTVPAAGSLIFEIDAGPRYLEFIPEGLRTLAGVQNMTTDLRMKIEFNDPPGSKDMDLTNDIITGKLKYENDGPFETNAFFELNDGLELVQNTVSSLNVFNNQATYELSPNASLSSMSSYSSSSNVTGDIPPLLNSTFLQLTSGRWRRSRGLSAAVSHSFAKMSTDAGPVLLPVIGGPPVLLSGLNKSTNNILTGDLLLPTHWRQHEVGLRLLGNFLADEKLEEDDLPFASNLISAELSNKLAFRSAGFRWKPKHTFKTTKNTTRNVDSTSDELESKLAVEAERPELWRLGKVRLKAHYDWRRKENEVIFDTKNHYLFEVGITKKFNDAYNLKVSTAVDNESFGLRSKAAAEVRPRATELRKSLRADFQASPADGVNLTANGMWIATNETNISKYTVSVRAVLPVIGLPIRSFLTKESRISLVRSPTTGLFLPDKELLEIETKLSYNFRQIKLVVSHSLTDEILDNQRYVYNEFQAKISRNFDIF